MFFCSFSVFKVDYSRKGGVFLISKDVIDEIVARNDIESLIGSYVSLKRAGSTLKALCPFHSEKSPSFTVYPSDNSFYCFGCGIGGDAITFVRQAEHLDYPDAIEFLAKRAGIVIPDDKSSAYSSGPRIDKKRMYAMNVDAAKFFNANLFADNPDSRAALRYFLEERRLSLATVKHFGLGFAPNSFDAFSSYMRKKGYTLDELVLGFLAGKSEKGHYYDAFRNRVMFPIIDVAGNVIAFGGRVMDDSKPKYKNSSDTPVFKKSRNLFALNFAKNHSQESIILCEGYMDVIALHAAGFPNAVATLGTAITAEQARVLSRYTKKVIISYDADEAGQKAANRAIKLLGDVGLDVSILRIPGAKDPDEFIKKNGKDEFARLLSNPKSKFEYNFENILSRFDIELPQDKINALGELVKLVSEVYSSAERDVYTQAISKRLQVAYKSVQADVERVVEKKRRAERRDEERRIKEKTRGFSDTVNPDYAKAPAVAKNEETVLGILLLYPEKVKTVIEDKLLAPSDFFTEFNRRIFEEIERSYREDLTFFDIANETFTPEEVGRIMKIKIARMTVPSTDDSVLTEAIATLRRSMQKREAASNSTFEGLEAILKRKRDN